MPPSKQLDCRGLNCPQPVIQTKDTLAEMTEQELVVIVDNDAACSNVSRYAESQGHKVTVKAKEGVFLLHIARGEGGEVTAEPEINCPLPMETTIVIYITSEFLGTGDDELGTVLMKAYFETLNHFATDISHIILVHSAVKLAVEGSPVLSYLQDLQEMDIEVLVCGTCLQFFDIRDSLRAGTISNMFSILDIQAKAAKVLTP